MTTQQLQRRISENIAIVTEVTLDFIWQQLNFSVEVHQDKTELISKEHIKIRKYIVLHVNYIFLLSRV
jgi:hypothetical protein